MPCDASAEPFCSTSLNWLTAPDQPTLATRHAADDMCSQAMLWVWVMVVLRILSSAAAAAAACACTAQSLGVCCEWGAGSTAALITQACIAVDQRHVAHMQRVFPKQPQQRTAQAGQPSTTCPEAQPLCLCCPFALGNLANQTVLHAQNRSGWQRLVLQKHKNQ